MLAYSSALVISFLQHVINNIYQSRCEMNSFIIVLPLEYSDQSNRTVLGSPLFFAEQNRNNYELWSIRTLHVYTAHMMITMLGWKPSINSPEFYSFVIMYERRPVSQDPSISPAVSLFRIAQSDPIRCCYTYLVFIFFVRRCVAFHHLCTLCFGIHLPYSVFFVRSVECVQ